MIRKYCLFLLFIFCLSSTAKATDANKLFDSLRRKILVVKDYTAEVKMKINVRYMRIPQLAGTLYFKSPDKMRLERHGGLSILPKKNINLSLRTLIPTGNVTVIDAGNAVIGTKNTRIIKVIPEDDKSDIILAKIWIDEKSMVALRTETTSRTGGTMTMDLEYGNYTNYGLPDKVLLTLDVKDFKVPKGVTMDYIETGDEKQENDGKQKKGTIQITYLKYMVNTGINDNVFTVQD